MGKVNTSERFFSLIEKTETCWLWHGCINPTNGYGLFSWLGYTNLGAHVVSFQIHNNRWAIHLVLHKCNNKICVRPDHLYDGTYSDNLKDQYNNGRIARYHGGGRKL